MRAVCVGAAAEDLGAIVALRHQVAMRDSDANRFCLHHGFSLAAQTEFRQPLPACANVAHPFLPTH